MDAGLLDERYDQIPDLVRARNLPSMQLIGSPDRTTVDLNSLSGLGVRLVGRLAGIRDRTAQFSGSLANTFALADLKLGRLLDTIDAWATQTGWDNGDPPRRFAHGRSPLRTIDHRPTFRRNQDDPLGHRVPPGSVLARRRVFDRKGHVRHDGGVHLEPRLVPHGAPILRRRKSSFIDGAAADAADLSGHLAHYLDSN